MGLRIVCTGLGLLLAATLQADTLFRAASIVDGSGRARANFRRRPFARRVADREHPGQDTVRADAERLSQRQASVAAADDQIGVADGHGAGGPHEHLGARWGGDVPRGVGDAYDRATHVGRIPVLEHDRADQRLARHLRAPPHGVGQLAGGQRPRARAPGDGGRPRQCNLVGWRRRVRSAG